MLEESDTHEGVGRELVRLAAGVDGRAPHQEASVAPVVAVLLARLGEVEVVAERFEVDVDELVQLVAGDPSAGGRQVFGEQRDRDCGVPRAQQAQDGALVEEARVAERGGERGDGSILPEGCDTLLRPLTV